MQGSAREQITVPVSIIASTSSRHKPATAVTGYALTDHNKSPFLPTRCADRKTHKLTNHPSRGRMFLKLRKMTLDKSPSGLAIEPQIEDAKDEFEDDLYEASILPSRMSRATDSKETDGDSFLSADIGEDLARLKAVTAETSVELQAQRRDIDRVSATVRRLEREMSQMRDLMERIRSEAITRSTGSALSQREGMGYPVEELELLTANITSIGAKVNGIDGLKLEFEMMKRRIKRMEDANNATRSLAAFAQKSLRATPIAKSTNISEGSSQRKRPESVLPHDEDDASYVDQPETGTPESGPPGRTLSASISSEGLKESHHRARSSTLDEPIPNSERVELDGDKRFGSERRGSEVHEEKPSPKHTVPPTFVTPAKRRAPKATEQFFSYDVPVIDNSQDDDYIPHSRSTAVQGASNSPRARGQPRGRGSGRKPRTSLNARQYGTPEWEKPDWVGQSGKDEKITGSTTASKRGGGVSRRGTGGGSYSEPRRAQGQSSTDRTPSLEDTEVYRLTPRSGRGGSSTIRPRDQRQRDSEGYLLTAKGTRDGRSKFWKDVGAGLKPNPNFSDDTRAANSSRHAKIMQQIFPDGVEEGKRRSNLAQQLFSKDKISNRTNGEGDVEKVWKT